MNRSGPLGGSLHVSALLVFWLVAVSTVFSLRSGAAADVDDLISSAETRVGPGTPSGPTEAVLVRVIKTYAKLPLHFEANSGQANPQVKFLTRSGRHIVFLTPTEAVLVLTAPKQTTKDKFPKTGGNHGRSEEVSRAVLRMTFVGANPTPRVTGLDELPGKANYFIGNEPAKWRTNVPTFAKVRYDSLYPGIDLIYYGNQRQLEYDFVLRPGADPTRIVLGVQGADRLEVDAHGDLVLHTAVGPISQRRPIIYQEVDGVRKEIAGGYVLKGPHQVGFRVAAYDASRPLIIDPVLVYSSYLGGSGGDEGRGIAADAGGNAYIAGTTGSANFPTAGALQPLLGGMLDAFVAKLNPSGTALVYATYLGGSGDDEGRGIAVDGTGNAYVTGTTASSNFPTTAGVFQPSFGGGAEDGFVTKLNSTGSMLVYSTYLGGSGAEQGRGIAVDGVGNAYVTGRTESSNFPTTTGASQTTFGGGLDDAFVTKLNPAGSALVYSTYLGGNGTDQGWGIAVDGVGNAYVTGRTDSTNFPTTAGAFQTTFGGTNDAFVTKLNSAGSTRVYSTYLGGGAGDEGKAIAVDAMGNAYVTGLTASSASFPTTTGAAQTTFGGGFLDAFVTKLNSAGSALTYSTFLGGSGDEQGFGIAVDGGGNAYVTGDTASTNFPTTAGAVQTTFGGGGFDAFLTTLNPTGTGLLFSTYLGGSGSEEALGMGMAVDASSSPNAYATGRTGSTNFPTTSGALQTTFGGGITDAFVVKIAGIVPPPPPPPGPPETTGKVTGGGTIKVTSGTTSGKGTFGLEARRKTLGEPARGTVEYHNHLTRASVHGIVNSLSVDETTGTFHLAGTCKGGSSCAVFTVDGQDVREPGKGADKFTITYCTSAGPPATGCTTDGAPPNDVIEKGNLQVHDP